MQKPTLGWQSWSPPYPRWHGFPQWDYSPHHIETDHLKLRSLRPLQQKIAYWCSWYAHDTRINDHLIKNTVSLIRKKKLLFTHILIDDGWTAWGDWLNPDLVKFPDFKKTIKDIHKAGYQVGLWFAPFLADRHSSLHKDHPDWFIKYKNRPIQGLKTMPIWDSLIPQRYLLNFSLPEVRQYTKEYLKRAVNEWEVDLLKLDFLYSPYFDPNLSSFNLPATHLQWLLNHIKKNYPKVQTIACGSPFGDSTHLVDAIRISKDTALPPFAPKFINKIVYANRVKMLNNTLQSEYSTHLNADPDVRMFSLDNAQTSSFWDTIQTPIIGVGDNLLGLDKNKLFKMKIWLQNHSSQS